MYQITSTQLPLEGQGLTLHTIRVTLSSAGLDDRVIEMREVTVDGQTTDGAMQFRLGRMLQALASELMA